MVNLPAKVAKVAVVAVMGCCYGTPSVPENEYAKTMPTLEGPEDFVVKKQGMFSDDYLVYKGGDAAEGKVDETTRWMFLNKTGNWWSGDAKIELENYIREDPDHPKKGQVLWIATFTDRPHFEQHLSWGHHRHPRFFGFFDEYDSDDDEGYWDRSHYPGRCFNRFMIKWSLSTTVTIAPGDTGARFGPPDMATVELRVFAKGTATRWIKRRIVRHQDEDGNVTREVVFDNHDKEFVDWIEFQLVHKQSGTPWALFRCRGDIDGGGDLQWECPLFKAELSGGFFSPGPCNVSTQHLWDPTLALLVAHLCSTEYCPNALRNDFVPNYPSRGQFRGGRRPHGRQFNPWAHRGPDRPRMCNATAMPNGIAVAGSAMGMAAPSIMVVQAQPSEADALLGGGEAPPGGGEAAPEGVGVEMPDGEPAAEAPAGAPEDEEGAPPEEEAPPEEDAPPEEEAPEEEAPEEPKEEKEGKVMEIDFGEDPPEQPDDYEEEPEEEFDEGEDDDEADDDGDDEEEG